MLHEEFVKLTRVNVSRRFYNEEIEPLYAEGNPYENKENWCADWLKNNKKHLVKAHSFDVEALSRDICLMDAIRAENQRIKEEKVLASQKAIQLEFDNEALKTENETLKNELVVNSTVIDEQIQSIGEYSAELEKSNNALLSAAKSLNELIIQWIIHAGTSFLGNRKTPLSERLAFIISLVLNSAESHFYAVEFAPYRIRRIKVSNDNRTTATRAFNIGFTMCIKLVFCTKQNTNLFICNVDCRNISSHIKSSL
ncbi:MAG: hypothetical protein LBC86_02105 [Oscillospiraceae bacterium]|jgi:hypothetical protein|nr:hypothetical protein [Oscillospiraceae bacterium]